MNKCAQFFGDRSRAFCARKLLIFALLAIFIFAIPLYAVADPGVHTGESGILAKLLRLPEGTTVPVDARFQLSFEATQAVLSENPPIMTRSAGDVPAITGSHFITLNPVIPDPVGGTITATGSYDLWSMLSGLDYPGGGVFLWNVTEVYGSSNTVEPGTMTYDRTSFQIRAYVDRDGDLTAVETYRINDDGSLSDKLAEGIVFENSYRRTTGTNIENSALEIRKEVEGNFANLGTPFNFELSLIEHSLASLPTTVTAYVIDSDGEEIRSLDVVDGALSFVLSHGESLVIPTLPAGTRFSVKEIAHPEFRPSAEVFSGGVSAEYTGDPNTDLQTGEYLIRDTGRNAADFTNVHQFSPATGLFSNSFVVPMILGIVAGIVILAALRKHRTIEEISVLG